MILTVLTSAVQVFLSLSLGLSDAFLMVKMGLCTLGRVATEMNFRSHHIILLCVGWSIFSTWLIHWSEVFPHRLVEVLFARILYCKVKTSYVFVLNLYVFCVADIWHSFWLSYSLNPLPIIRNFLPWEFLLGWGSRLKCVTSLLEIRVRNSCGSNHRYYVSRQWGRCHVEPTSEGIAEI